MGYTWTMALRITNLRTGAALAEHAGEARSFGARLKGLLGRQGLMPGEGLLIEPCNGVHSFFMRFSIDVAFLTTEGEVVLLLHQLRPWRASPVVPRARMVLELPAGTLQATGTRVGDRLQLQPSPT